MCHRILYKTLDKNWVKETGGLFWGSLWASKHLLINKYRIIHLENSTSLKQCPRELWGWSKESGQVSGYMALKWRNDMWMGVKEIKGWGGVKF